jgi:hypothetical protein
MTEKNLITCEVCGAKIDVETGETFYSEELTSKISELKDSIKKLNNELKEAQKQEYKKEDVKEKQPSLFDW